MKKYIVFLFFTFVLAVFVSGCHKFSVDNEYDTKMSDDKREKKSKRVREVDVDTTKDAKRSRGKNEEIVNLEYDYVDVGEKVRLLLPELEQFKYRISFKKIGIDSNRYGELSKALDRFYKDAIYQGVGLINKVHENVNVDYPIEVNILGEPRVIRADNSILSMEFYFEESFDKEFATYSDGKNEVSEYHIKLYRTFNFDMESKKEIQFHEIVADEKAFFDTAKSIIRQMDYANADIALTEADVNEFMEKGITNFIVDYDTLKIHNSAWDYYSTWGWTISVPLRKYPEIFSLDYSKVPKSYITHLDGMGLGYVDLDGDGIEEMFCVNSLEGYKSAGQDLVGFRVKTENNDYWVRIDEMTYVEKGAIVHLENGKKFLYLSLEMEGTDYMGPYITTYLVDLNTNGKNLFQNFGNRGRMKKGFVDPKHVVIEERSEIIGTFECYRDGHISEEGVVIPVQGLPYFDLNTYVMYSKVDLYLKGVDEDLNVLEQEIHIPPREKLKPVYTNNQNYVILEREDRSLVQIEVIDMKFNGISLDDIFDNLAFAG